MNFSFSKITNFKERIVSFVLLAFIFALAPFFLRSYLIFNGALWFGLVLAGIMIAKSGNNSRSIRFLFLFVPMFVLAIVTKTHTFLFLAWLAGILLCVELCFKKLPLLVFLVLLLVSPIASYLITSFGFEIKLMLTNLAAQLLRSGGAEVLAEGNSIFMNNQRFVIDTACIGLSMGTYSFLIATALLFFMNEMKRIPVWAIVLCFAAAFGLNIFANLTRILLIVVFKIMPSQALHYWLGLICFVAYTAFPLFFLTRWINKRNRPVEIVVVEQRSNKWTVLMPIFVFVALVCAGIVVSQKQVVFVSTQNALMYKNYSKTFLHDGVLQLSDSVSLIYLKPILSFYSAEHNPSICWRGSGYSIERITTQKVRGVAVYFGIMQKGNEQLYTAWWLASGKEVTINQLCWRWQMLAHNKRYTLINVSTQTEAQLMQEVERVMNW